MVSRRNLLSGLVALPAAATLSSRTAAAGPSLSGIRTRHASRIERLYATPHGKPNALDITDEGLWVMDQDPGNWASVLNPETGNLIREFKCANVRAASGICVDEDGVWVGSTYNRLIVLNNPQNGDLIANYPTPGAGLIYDHVDDPPGRRSDVERARPVSPDLPRRDRIDYDLPPGQLPLHMTEAPAGTGAHAILSKDGRLYVAVPPARAIFVIEKKSWLVLDEWPTASKRPHGSCWANSSKDSIWAADSNLNAFFLHDASSGEIVERLQLPDDSPVIHGATLHNGHMYFCDDVGWVFRFRM